MEDIIRGVFIKVEKRIHIRDVLVKIGMVQPTYGCREAMHDIDLYFKLSAFYSPEDRDVREVKERLNKHLPGIGTIAGANDCLNCALFYLHVQRKMTGESTQ